MLGIVLHGSAYCTVAAGRRWIDQGLRDRVVMSILTVSSLTGEGISALVKVVECKASEALGRGDALVARQRQKQQQTPDRWARAGEGMVIHCDVVTGSPPARILRCGRGWPRRALCASRVPGCARWMQGVEVEVNAVGCAKPTLRGEAGGLDNL